MEKDYNNFIPPFYDYSGTQSQQFQGSDINDIYKDPMFNPMMQYDQAFCYYRSLCMQMDYKIKCKEYEKMCSNSNSSSDRVNRRVE